MTRRTLSWSDIHYSCLCGRRFRSYGAEAYHRHNFPLLCKQPKQPKPKRAKPVGASKENER